MPEGHTIHRLARQHTRLLGGRTITAASPQGRAVEAAAEIDGRVLEAVDAHGKHLLYRFGPSCTLHVHLGLYGRFRRVPVLRGTPRLVLGDGADPDVLVQLSGPTACELLAPPQEDRLLARLGPDPLRPDADPARVRAALGRRRIALGAALLDQSVVAGIGNAYRAEMLLEAGLDPFRPARSLSPEEFDRLWAVVAAQLRRGVRSGRITPRRLYRRSRCGSCGGPVATAPLAGRTLYWCPREQGGDAAPAAAGVPHP
jgi:formamidopyrimidine-DNA glycosylase